MAPPGGMGRAPRVPAPAARFIQGSGQGGLSADTEPAQSTVAAVVRQAAVWHLSLDSNPASY